MTIFKRNMTVFAAVLMLTACSQPVCPSRVKLSLSPLGPDMQETMEKALAGNGSQTTPSSVKSTEPSESLWKKISDVF